MIIFSLNDFRLNISGDWGPRGWVEQAPCPPLCQLGTEWHRAVKGQTRAKAHFHAPRGHGSFSVGRGSWWGVGVHFGLFGFVSLVATCQIAFPSTLKWDNTQVESGCFWRQCNKVFEAETRVCACTCTHMHVLGKRDFVGAWHVQSLFS